VAKKAFEHSDVPVFESGLHTDPSNKLELKNCIKNLPRKERAGAMLPKEMMEKIRQGRFIRNNWDICFLAENLFFLAETLCHVSRKPFFIHV
jgi:hypothetical protein